MRIVHGRGGLLLAAFLVAGSMVNGCSCGNDTSISPPPPTKVVQRQVSLLCVDATTGLPMTDPVTVSVVDDTGHASTVSRDANGVAQNRFTTTTGTLVFQVDKDATLPVHIALVTSAAGYNSTSAKVDFTADGAVSATARMVKVSAPPPGVAAVQQAVGSASTTGTISAAISVATPPEANTLAAATVAVSSATTITTADGAPLKGALQATVAYYNNQDASSLEAFPGGLDVSVPLTPGAAKQNGAFISGGFTAITVTDEAGNVAANFSKPVVVSVGIPASTINPKTGLTVQPGDVIPFWSYNEATGQWQPEGDVTVALAGGKLIGTAQVSHLSYFNLDWFQDVCPNPAPIQIAGNPNKLQLTLHGSIIGNGWSHEYTLAGDDVNTVTLHNVPRGTPLRFVASFGGQVVGSVDVNDICAGTAVTLPVALPSVSAATLNVKVQNACVEDSSKRSAIGSAGVLLIDDATHTTASAATDLNGDASFTGLVAGRTYDLLVTTLAGQHQAQQKTLAGGANTAEVLFTQTCQVTGAGGSGK